MIQYSILSIQATFIALLLDLVNCHSWLVYPPPRGNIYNTAACSAGEGCKGPCDSPKSFSKVKHPFTKDLLVGRGDKLNFVWPRANHPGGFVRLSAVPFESSDDWSAFDSHANKYVCYETNCGPEREYSSWGKNNGPGFANCTTSFTVPDYLPDGEATIQWVWYGGGIYYAQPDTAFGEYYNCVDIRVRGGNSFSQETPPAEFQGGDVTYPGEQKCKYWGSNKVGDCRFGNAKPSNPNPEDVFSLSLEPCSRGAEKSGAPFGF